MHTGTPNKLCACAPLLVYVTVTGPMLRLYAQKEAIKRVVEGFMVPFYFKFKGCSGLVRQAQRETLFRPEF